MRIRTLTLPALLFPDGTSKSFPVRKDVDLAKHSVGDEVVIRPTESVAVRVEKPQPRKPICPFQAQASRATDRARKQNNKTKT